MSDNQKANEKAQEIKKDCIIEILKALLKNKVVYFSPSYYQKISQIFYEISIVTKRDGNEEKAKLIRLKGVEGLPNLVIELYEHPNKVHGTIYLMNKFQPGNVNFVDGSFNDSVLL